MRGICLLYVNTVVNVTDVVGSPRCRLCRCSRGVGRLAAMQGERERKKVTDAASGRACGSVFFLRPALGGTTSQACSWRAWVLGDEHAGGSQARCACITCHMRAVEATGGGGYAPALS